MQELLQKQFYILGSHQSFWLEWWSQCDSMRKWMMFKWVFFLIGGSWGNLKCLGRMIRSLYNKNQDPELDCCVGELYRMSIVCFLRTTLTPPGRFSVSPFLKDNCTSDFPNWAFNLKGKNPLFRLRKLVSYKCMHHFTLTFFTQTLFWGYNYMYFIMNVNTSLFFTSNFYTEYQ